ncbi:hypothetical protein ACOMCU_27365 [Lysinibacillus sp. UGB7]|uniref:hypothetical protein n=1 Tax=Lysinibacillus sp. UGB7 TaxID=3411039 RepID=UPI003B7BCD10
MIDDINPHSSEHSSNLNLTNEIKKNHHLPFSCILTIPKGFQLKKHSDPNFVYDLSCLSMTKEKCQKFIEVEDCGRVEVDLHVLKIKGCLFFILNLFIEPICIEKFYTTQGRETFVSLCYQETLYVDHVLKYSTGELPYYSIDGKHIQIRDLKVELLNESSSTVKVSGFFFFEYD